MIRNIAKVAGWVAVALVGLVIIAFLILKAITDEQYQQWIESAAESATGRTLVMEDFSFDLGTSVFVSADGVSMANAQWGEQPDMLTMGHAEAEISLIALLGGVADVRLVAQDAEVLVETSGEGEINWALGSPEGEVDEQPEKTEQPEQESGSFELPLQPLLREIRLENIQVSFVAAPAEQARQAAIQTLLIETPEADTMLSLSAEVAAVPIEMSGNLGNIAEVLTVAENPLELGGRVEENTFNITGTWGPMYPKANLQLAVIVDAPSTSRLAELAGISLEELGELSVAIDLSAVDGHLSISRLLTNLDGEIAGASIQGSVGDLVGMQELNLTTEANIEFLNKLLRQFGVEMPMLLPPDVDVSAQITGSLDPLGVRDFKTTVQDEGLQITVTGTIEDALDIKGVDGAFELKAESTAIFSKYADVEIPDLGAVTITGNVRSEGELLRLFDLDARVTADNVAIVLTGVIEDLVGVNGIGLNLDADILSFSEQNIADLEQLFKKLEIEVPLEMLPQSIGLEAAADGNLEQLSVSELLATIVDEGLNVSLTGSIDNAITVEGIQAEARVESTSTSVFSKYAGTEIPDLGPVDVTARVRSSGESYELESVNAHVGTDDFDVSLTASVSDLIALSGINATVDSNLSSLSSLSDVAGTDLPETTPIVLHAELKGPDISDDGPTTVGLNLKSGNTEVEITTIMGNLRATDDIQVAVAVTSDSLADFNQFTGRDFPEDGPLSLSGDVSVKPGHYALDDFALQIGEQAANGNIGVTLAQNEGELTTINGVLDIPYLDLSPYFTPSSTDSADPVTTQNGEAPAHEGKAAETDLSKVESTVGDENIDEVATDRLFSTDPIALEALRLINADVSITADKLVIGKSSLNDLKIGVKMEDGLLVVDPLSGSGSGSGSGDESYLKGHARIDGSGNTLDMDVDVVIANLPMINLGGAMDVNFDLDGQGQSVAELMGSLNGQLLVVLQDGTIPHGLATNFGSGLFSFSGGKDSTALECAILRMDIVDGIADFDNQLAAQLTDVTWRGGGEINLKTEKLGVGITPKPRKGIGISAGSLASLVYVGGTLKQPEVKLNPKDVAMKYGKYMAYISTGGLSLVAEVLFNKSKANQDVCAQILDDTVFDEDPEELMKAQAEAEAKAKEEGSTE